MPIREKFYSCLSQTSSSLLGVCYHLSDDEQSLNKHHPSGKLIIILGPILERSLAFLASSGINFSASIIYNFFVSNMYLDCGLDCRLV